MVRSHQNMYTSVCLYMAPVRSELRIFRTFAPSNHGGGHRQNTKISACLYMARGRSEWCIFLLFAPVSHCAAPPKYVYFRMFVHGPCEVRIAHFPYMCAFQPYGGHRQNRYISACLYMARVRSEWCIFRIFAHVGHGATPPIYVYFRI